MTWPDLTWLLCSDPDIRRWLQSPQTWDRASLSDHLRHGVLHQPRHQWDGLPAGGENHLCPGPLQAGGGRGGVPGVPGGEHHRQSGGDLHHGAHSGLQECHYKVFNIVNPSSYFVFHPSNILEGEGLFARGDFLGNILGGFDGIFALFAFQDGLYSWLISQHPTTDPRGDLQGGPEAAVSDCVPQPEDGQGAQIISWIITLLIINVISLSQVKDFVKYCMNDDATSSERLNEVVVNPRGIVLDGDIDFSQIERLRRPKKSPPSIKSGRTNQLSNRDRLLRFHQTNWCNLLSFIIYM